LSGRCNIVLRISLSVAFIDTKSAIHANCLKCINDMQATTYKHRPCFHLQQRTHNSHAKHRMDTRQKVCQPQTSTSPRPQTHLRKKTKISRRKLRRQTRSARSPLRPNHHPLLCSRTIAPTRSCQQRLCKRHQHPTFRDSCSTPIERQLAYAKIKQNYWTPS